MVPGLWWQGTTISRRKNIKHALSIPLVVNLRAALPGAGVEVQRTEAAGTGDPLGPETKDTKYGWV